MTAGKMIILADDLTGANDTAIQFVKAGLHALVIPRAPEDLSSGNDYDVISLNSNSRAMKAEDAYRAVREMAVSLETLRGDYFIYKKMDSVLRGNPAEELEAVMDELKIPLAIVAPSFPANRSTLEQGMLSSGAGEANAVELFARGMKRRVEGIPLEELRKGPGAAADYVAGGQGRGAQVFIADAVTDGDLETVYRLSSSLGSPLIFAGAAGLANQIARHIAGAAGKKKAPGPALSSCNITN
jgi:uncharacterized protein YgbK (DUF1537 family)